MRPLLGRGFLSIHDPINNLVNLRRDHRSASEYRAAQAQAFAAWAEVAGVPLAAYLLCPPGLPSRTPPVRLSITPMLAPFRR